MAPINQVAGLDGLAELLTTSSKHCLGFVSSKAAPDKGQVDHDLRRQPHVCDLVVLPAKPAETYGYLLSLRTCGLGGRWGSSRVAPSDPADYSITTGS